MSFFGGVKRAARITRLKTELLLHDREVGQRQDAFGVQLYDYLEPLSKNQDFYSADDRLTQVLRPPMLEAQRETAVVYNKIRQLKERMKQQEIKRAAAFPNKAQNWQEQLSNAAKSTALAGQETKLKAEMVILERELKSYKQTFGRALYGTLEELEDKEGWLPTDREVRSIYDDCRKDIEAAKKKAKVKLDELETLGVSAKELQNERSEAARAEQQKNNQGLWGGNSSSNNNQNTGYDAPPPSSAPPPTSDPYASTPTSQLPVATSVGFASSSHETPAMAFGTVAPPPAAPAPVISNNNFGSSGGYAAPAMGSGNGGDPFAAPSSNVSSGGMGSFGGGVMGGSGPPPPQSYNSSSNVMGSAMGTGGSFGGDSGGFAMGGSAGMGTGGNSNVMGGSADPWANNDPFAMSSPPPPSSVPPTNPPPQAGAHKDANLFLY